MKLDARNLSSGETIVSDVCIVGAGPAGITAAREFIGSGLQVNVLESGGDAHDFEVQRLSEGELSGHLYEPQESTHMRQIGGTANHLILKMTDKQYGYRYAPMESFDFEKREAIPYSGWPITKLDLDPYYERAQNLCEIGTYNYSADFWVRGALQPMPLPADKLSSSVFMFGPTRKFTVDFPNIIKQSENVNIYAHATVVELICTEDGKAVETAVVRMFDGKEIYFKAKHFVIASNALQTPRLLLNSRRSSHHPNGIGNQHDNVGRYYMDHNLVPSGNFIPNDPKYINQMGFYDMQRIDGASVLGRLSLSEALIKKEGLRNFAAMLFPMSWNKNDLDAMYSLNELKQHLRWNWKHYPKDLFKHLSNIFKGRNRLFRALHERIIYGIPVLLSLGNGGWSRSPNNEKKYDRLELLALVEQTPNPENRVALINEKDALGCYKTKLHFNFSDDDLVSIKRTQEIIGQAISESGLGRYEPPNYPMEKIKTFLGLHHMLGTTRMSIDPKNGVVDSDCCVHGVHNLFIASSATFTTGSYVNPTLTNLALSIRIADKIKVLTLIMPDYKKNKSKSASQKN